MYCWCLNELCTTNTQTTNRRVFESLSHGFQSSPSYVRSFCTYLNPKVMELFLPRRCPHAVFFLSASKHSARSKSSCSSLELPLSFLPSSFRRVLPQWSVMRGSAGAMRALRRHRGTTPRRQRCTTPRRQGQPQLQLPPLTILLSAQVLLALLLPAQQLLLGPWIWAPE